MKRPAIVIFVLLSFILMATANVSAAEPKYAPSTEELKEEVLVFSELTHGALIDWQVKNVESVTEENLQELELFDELHALNYGELVEYFKRGKELKVIVLEFNDEGSAKSTFSKSMKKAVSLGAVPSPEFGNEGYATGEKSSLHYIHSYRLGQFIVYVEAKEAGLYDVKMMARKIMKDLLPYYEGQVFGLGPIKISEYQLDPVMDARNNGIYMKMFQVFIPKNFILGLLAAVIFAGLIAFVLVVVLVFVLYSRRKKRKEK